MGCDVRMLRISGFAMDRITMSGLARRRFIPSGFDPLALSVLPASNALRLGRKVESETNTARCPLCMPSRLIAYYTRIATAW